LGTGVPAEDAPLGFLSAAGSPFAPAPAGSETGRDLPFAMALPFALRYAFADYHPVR
jgi:hypothetical protein